MSQPIPIIILPSSRRARRRRLAALARRVGSVLYAAAIAAGVLFLGLAATGFPQ